MHKRLSEDEIWYERVRIECFHHMISHDNTMVTGVWLFMAPVHHYKLPSNNEAINKTLEV